MPGNGLFHKLILRWFLLRQQGLTLSSADLCRACPEHQAEVEQSLQQILALGGRTVVEGGPDPNAASGTLLADLPPAAGPSPVSGLLLRWQEQREQGIDLSADELCQDCPEHREEISGRVRAMRDFYALLGAVDLPGASSASPMPAPPGYAILEPLGEGGMGLVYKARQVKLDRIVALKVIRDGAHASGETLARFRTEAGAIARLQHPNIVQVFEVGEHDGRPFLAMEFCPGGGLDRKLGGIPLSPRAAAELMATLAQAMEAAHRACVVHRDLKPANILLAADGTPKISDFGLARKTDEAGQTQTGAVMGTPSYMAPEQARAEETVGPAADVYALGAILYELLTGRPPFRGSTANHTIQLVLTAEPASPRRLNPKVPRDLEAICLTCLEKEPGRRYATAAELADDLRRFQAGEPIQARPVGALERAWRWCRRNPAVAGALGLVVLSLLAGSVTATAFAFRADRERQTAEQAQQGEAARAEAEASAKHEAEAARRSAQRQLIDLCGASGLTAAREQDHALALLWFARAAQLAKEEPEQQEINRIRYANWLRHVWMPEGTFPVPRFRHGQDRFRVLQFSPDGNYLVGVADLGACLLWDRQRGRLVELAGPAAHGFAAAWQPRGEQLAVAGKDGKVRLLAPPTFQVVEELPAGDAVTVLAFSRDGRRLAWGGAKGVRVWDREKMAYATPFLPHGGSVVTIAFSASGELLATASRDRKARVFRVQSEKAEPLFPPIPNAVDYGLGYTGPEPVAPRFANGDKTLLTVERTGALNTLVWRSAATGAVLACSGGRAGDGHLSAFDVSPQGDRVAAVWEGPGRFLEAQTGGVLTAIPWNDFSWCEEVVYSSDGKTVFTCGQDAKVQSWAVEGKGNLDLPVASPPIRHPTQAVRIAISDDNRHLAVALRDGTVCLWQAGQGLPSAYAIAAGGTTWPALSPDRRLVLPRGTSHRSGTLRETRVYDATTGAAIGPKLRPGGILVDAAFSPDGTRVALAALTAQTPDERNQRLFLPEGKAGNLQIWDWKSGTRLLGPVALPAEPRGLAFAPDGKVLAVVCADYRAVLVDAATGVIRHNLDSGTRTRPLNANLWTSNGEARFSSDGHYLVTWELAHTLHVWDPGSGRLLHTLTHTDRVENLAFHPRKPSVVATGGRDAQVKIWDLSTGKLLAQLPHPRLLIGIQFSPDGTELITGCNDGIVRHWDAQTWELKRGLPHNPAFSAFDLTADRRRLIALGLFSLQVSDWHTGTPLGPEWNLGSSVHLGLSLPAGDRRAIVGGFTASLVGYDLEKMLTPATAPIENLVQLAELAAGRRILSQGNVVALTSSEWVERWQRLQKDGIPLLPAPSAGP